MQTRDAISQLAEKQLSRLGLTPEKFHTLVLCVNSTEPITVAELSRMLFRKPHTVSGIVNRMEEEGLLKRERLGTQENQGPMHISVTDHGTDVYKQGLRIMMRSVARIMERVPKEELEQLDGGLRSLRNSILSEMNIQPLKITLQLR